MGRFVPGAIAAGGVLAVALASGACGVEVPEGAGATDPTTTTSTTTVETPTSPPESSDEVEQFLIDNGFSLSEARCGAAELRASLTTDRLDELLDAGNLDDIDERTASLYAESLQSCLD